MPTTLKLFATGSGHASKDDMVAAAERELGRSGLSDDEADAYHFALLAGPTPT